MLERCFAKGCNVIKKIVSTVSDEQNLEISKELININLQREKMLAVILCIISVMFLCSDIFIFDSIEKSTRTCIFSFYNHLALLIIPLLFLLALSFGKNTFLKNPEIAKIFHILINTLLPLMYGLNATAATLLDQPPLSYIIAMFCIASLVYLSPFERYFVFKLSYIAYVAGTLIVQPNILYYISDFLFVGILSMLASIVSRINHSSYVKNYINKKTILDKNLELDRLYKLAKEALEKRNQELLKTMEYEKARTDFFADISHELRTPLTVIFSAEQMMDFMLNSSEGGNIKQELGQYMKIIKQNCYRLIRLVSNLIDITKMDAGYFQINMKNCDIVRVVEDITLSVAKYMEYKNINFTFDTELEEKIIACDPDKIERIILNLLSNAIKFTPTDGYIFVSIYEKNDKIVISVKDTGIGIPEDIQKHVFDRFFQMEGDIQKNKQGSGIGLSLVKSLVEMHGGSISLISKEGIGSEFLIELPIRTISDKKTEGSFNLANDNGNVEKINIEFSDIYR